MTISVIANFKAKSDQKEKLEALLKSVIEPTLNEEGCLKYELYISENDLICAELAGDFHLGYARQLTDKSSLLFDLAF